LSNRNSHAYIIHGGDAKSPYTAELFAEMLGAEHRTKILRGIHPDIYIVGLEINKNTNKLRAEITVDQIRDAIYAASVIPNEAERAIIAIESAELMNANAQNALLKTLEEPPEHLRLVLITEAPGALLATGRSRCVVLEADVAETTAPQAVSDLSEGFFDALLDGETALCEFSFTLEKAERSDILALLPELRRLGTEKYRLGEISAQMALEIAERVKTAEHFFEHNVASTHIVSILCNI